VTNDAVGAATMRYRRGRYDCDRTQSQRVYTLTVSMTFESTTEGIGTASFLRGGALLLQEQCYIVPFGGQQNQPL